MYIKFTHIQIYLASKLNKTDCIKSYNINLIITNIFFYFRNTKLKLEIDR